MQRSAVLAVPVAVLLWTISLMAQEYPRAEVFGGYSYLNIDTNNALSSRQSANGWEASVSGNLSRIFAVEGSIAGYYKTYAVDLSSVGLGMPSIPVRDYAFLGGPRANVGPFFVHALLGLDRLSASTTAISGISASQNSFAGALGGGLEWALAGHWAVRGSADYYFTRHGATFLGGNRMTQNNYRVSTGIVYRFGRVAERNTTRGDRGSSSAVSVPALGVKATTTEQGARVVEVVRGSLAEQAGLQTGDVVTAINGQAVKTGLELAAACSSLAGNVKLTYLARGYWQTEKTVPVPPH